MKLYTEEQVKIAYSKGKNDGSTGFIRDFEQLNLLPIELPSDEEINKESHNHYMKGQLNIEPASNTEYAFKKGAKWMKEQILNQNK